MTKAHLYPRHLLAELFMMGGGRAGQVPKEYTPNVPLKKDAQKSHHFNSDKKRCTKHTICKNTE